ncbi:MAG TPA: PilZ domain-containing protein [Methylomirabilota bacterium]|nr:PilZ domain-containing protein [Methylomirabilota bacterium]
MSRSKLSLQEPDPCRPLRTAVRFSHLRDLSLVYEGHAEVIAIRTPDISTQGMFINTPTQFPEGSVLKLRFRLTQSAVEILARGEVRYCLPGVGIGVQFVHLAPESARAIEREVQRSSAAGGSRKR